MAIYCLKCMHELIRHEAMNLISITLVKLSHLLLLFVTSNAVTIHFSVDRTAGTQGRYLVPSKYKPVLRQDL